MTAQHTPEPWHREGNFVYALRLDPRHRTYRPNMVNVFSLYVQNDNHIASEEEIEANARLIAAAPFMLEALKTALVELKALINLDIRSNTAITNATTDMRTSIVRAAICAATGEEN